MSGIGKGVATASILKILQSKGYKVTALKIDPYLNVDAGTMNPTEHGEIFVTDDGAEGDQDLGNYERFADINLSKDNYITTGKVYQAVIEKERNLGYGGKCVEVVPDIPNEVIRRIKKAATISGADFVLIEIGGTIGEYQNLLFLEAARMMHLKNPKDVIFILVSYLPVPSTIGEMKTKPTQSASRLLNEAGIQPDIIIGRSPIPMDEVRKKKISTFCNLESRDVMSSPDAQSIYEVPILLDEEGIGQRIIKKLGLRDRKKDMHEWRNFVDKMKKAKKKAKIAIIGKYFETGDFVLSDSYISVIEAIRHSCYSMGYKDDISWLSAEKYEKDPSSVKELADYDGVIVPGGFGKRGVEGKIEVIRFCRENKVPFLGLCLGMQLAVIEFARNVCDIKNASSTEFSKDCTPVIDVMAEQEDIIKKGNYGGTMRLGSFRCNLEKGTISQKAYKSKQINERHRHRFEVNNKFRDIFERKEMIVAGTNPDHDLVEIIEIKNHPFFLATQFHPEYKSRPLNPHPLFMEFIRKATQQ